MNPIAESSMVNETVVDHRSSELNGSPIDQPLVEPAGATKSIKGALVKTLIVVVVLFGGVVFGLYKMRVDIPALNTTRIYAHIDSLSERIVSRYESYFHKHEGGGPPGGTSDHGHQPDGKGRHHHPAICLPDPLAASHRGLCLGGRVSRGRSQSRKARR